MSKRIWLIGGTQESRELAIALAQAQLPCVVTVTTEAAKNLYAATLHQVVVAQFLEVDLLQKFLQQQDVAAILDASHPYAVTISQQAIAAATQLNLPYLRFERPATTAIASSRHSVIEVGSLVDLLAGDYLWGKRVLLTLGYKSLPLFQPWHHQAHLFARILPSPIALETALQAGFSSERLIAIRPPVPAAIERAVWQHWQISCVVTKASGAAGGEDIKRAIAAELKVTLILITRPEIAYPHATSSQATALAFCHQQLSNQVG